MLSRRLPHSYDEATRSDFGFESKMCTKLQSINQSINISIYQSVSQSKTLFHFKFPESKRKSPDFNVNLRQGEISTSNLFKGRITFNKPVRFLTADSLLFQYDSITVQKIDTVNDMTWNYNRTELNIEKLLNPDLLKKDTTQKSNPQKVERRIPGNSSFEGRSPSNKVTLLLGENAFLSAEMDSSLQITESYNFVNPANLGVILGEVNTDYTNFIIQLTDKNFEVQRELVNEKAFEFKDLQPSDYKIRILIDTNQNGKWDEGQVSDFTEPEPVYHLNKTLTLRPNWELNEIITIE